MLVGIISEYLASERSSIIGVDSGSLLGKREEVGAALSRLDGDRREASVDRDILSGDK